MSFSSSILQNRLRMSDREQSEFLGVIAVALAVFLPVVGLPVSAIIYHRSKQRFEPNRLALIAVQIASLLLATLIVIAIVIPRLGS